MKQDDPVKKKHYNFLCRQVKKSAKEDKEKDINDVCNDVEAKQRQNSSRAVYEGISKIAGTRASRVDVVKDKNVIF